ncbi:hypothetical protein F5Y10DRAFT_264931 [Nemania abortiva]|nr:hypothetical protein F5Y10DRAFT_264931 [Nemania abortiva]
MRPSEASVNKAPPTSPLPIEKFRSLLEDFKRRSPKGSRAQLVWLDRLYKELGSNAIVEEYFNWVESESPIRGTGLANTILGEFSHLLQQANWKTGNSSLERLNTVLWDTRRHSSSLIQPLNRTHLGCILWLKIDGQPFDPPTADTDTCKHYDVNLLNPGFAFGMRYLPPNDDTSSHLEEQCLLFAPLGHIYFSPRFDDRQRYNSGLALLVEIVENGGAGDYIIMSNWENAEIRDRLPIDLASLCPAVFNGNLNFTVARVTSPLLSDCPPIEDPRRRGLSELEIKIESRSKPEIVPAGSKVEEEYDAGGALPIALYPFNKAGGKGASPKLSHTQDLEGDEKKVRDWRC